MISERLKQFLNDSTWSLTGVAIALVLNDLIAAFGITAAIAGYALLTCRDAR